jgi:hypothetical protein
MKKDMGGAAHVLGIARLVMSQQLPVRLRVLIPAVENAISGDAYRPGDIIRTRKGTTVEIDNTDAEGRLVLCDALALACETDPGLIIDFATLTGAARTALGTELPALFCNDDALALSDDAARAICSLPLSGRGEAATGARTITVARDCNAAPAAMPATNTSPISASADGPDNSLAPRTMVLVDHNPIRFENSILSCANSAKDTLASQCRAILQEPIPVPILSPAGNRRRNGVPASCGGSDVRFALAADMQKRTSEPSHTRMIRC